MRILGVVGMPGSGKSEAVEVFKKHGLSVISMGDVIREEARRRGYEVTPESLGRVSIALRREYGEEEIARRCVGRIKAELALHRDVVVEGIRSLGEVRYLRETFKGDFYIIAIHSSPKTRFHRLKTRGRGDDPGNWGTFEERDHRELGYGMGSVIALADYMVVNEGSLGELREKIEEVYRRIIH